MNIDPQKKILVVCSYKTGPDFINPLNDDLKLLFGNDPEYIFCFNLSTSENATACSFPQDINSDDKYDAIWFAGCNRLHAIFKNPDD